MSELQGNSVVITWSNDRRSHVVTQYGAEIGHAFRLPDARAIADNHLVSLGLRVGYMPREASGVVPTSTTK